MTASCPPKAGFFRRFFSKRLLLVFTLLIIVLAAPIVYLVFEKLAAEAERDAIVAELDRTDPGWQTAHVVSEAEKTPASRALNEEILAVHKLLPGSWGQRAALDDLSADIPPFRLPEISRFTLNAELDKVREAMDKARKLADGITGTPQLSYEAKQALSWLLYLLSVNARCRATEADFEGAALSLFAQLQGTRPFLPAKDLLDWFGVRTYGPTYDLEWILGQGEIDARHLARFQQQLETFEAEPVLQQALRGERARLHEMMRKLEAGALSVAATARFSPTKTPWSVAILDYLPGPMIAQSDACILRYYSEAIEITGRPIQEQRQVSFELDAKWTFESKDTPQLVKHVSPFNRHMILWGLTYRARLSCTSTAIAAERFRLANKRWPDSLAELVHTGFLKDIPIDPFDGQPLRYRPTDDGLVVYSLGQLHIKSNGRVGNNDGTLRDNYSNPPGADSRYPLIYEFRLWNPDCRGQPARLKSRLEEDKAD